MGITFIDTEIRKENKEVRDLGGIKENGDEFHSTSLPDFVKFITGSDYICGHNLLRHDLLYIEKEINQAKVSKFIDTLFWAPLLFPKKPYHKLLKDDKLCTDEFNNPLNDSKKDKDLFYDEISEFHRLDNSLKEIYFNLLHPFREFKYFFDYIHYKGSAKNIESLIFQYFKGKICANAPISRMIQESPIELAYALALITVIKYDSITPPWVLKNFPRVENIIHLLRGKRCAELCEYCAEALDETKALNRFFNYKEFRTYEGKPLQQNAVKATVQNKSILAIFPTGGGKSITFQLPALMSGTTEKGLTVVISPLQSLMKDQVDNLEERGIVEAVTINGALDPLEKAESYKRVKDGSASLLYVSPESLRSKSIENLLLCRNVVRFVIDEAHCFSAWGQDFRVDYLYIGDFIKQLQDKKGLKYNIPVSCFTATAKQKVISDILSYFRDKLSIELEVFRASAARSNLTYHVFNEDSEEDKYLKLRNLMLEHDCPTIIYVSRTHRTKLLADKLTKDGYPAVAYHGQMDKKEKVQNQELFMKGDIKVIVATTAFGMGVDKKDVGMVIHYDISDSIENYVQEAGRAGRDENIKADCYVLFNDNDLNKHFALLNQSKVNLKEIQQIWSGIKNFNRQKFSRSALEIARQAGWDESVQDIETRVKTAISALEQSGYIRRGQNMPRIFANSILVKNMEEARKKIDASFRFDDQSRQTAIRVIKSLISAKNISKGQDDDAESRIDYIADNLGMSTRDVQRTVELLREEKILADAKDLTASIKKRENENYSIKVLALHQQVEDFLVDCLETGEQTWNLKELNERISAINDRINLNHIKTILNYWIIKHVVKRTQESDKNYITIKPFFSAEELRQKIGVRYDLSVFIIKYLYSKINDAIKQDEEDFLVEFSSLEIKEAFEHNLSGDKTNSEEIDDALYYLTRINAVRIEGAFLVTYNAMQIERVEQDNKVRYKKEDYAQLAEHYKNKMQQIHIVGEYATRMVNDYKDAMTFVDDYFTMQYSVFLNKYFRGRNEQISQNITPKKFTKIFGELSPAQMNIIKDNESDCIVVAAGPGSGKTKLLVHKLASIYLMEDVKHEQMLMLTFSRAAVTEFKKRLISLIGNAANFVPIMTFHSFCFDLLGRVGTLEKADAIIRQTVDKIEKGEVDLARITKMILVIDEAQDMSESEFALVKILMEKNEGLRVIAVGDDDQNIYEFRGSSSKHLESLIHDNRAKKYELVDNYRSQSNIVELSNRFVEKISHRLKQTPIYAKNRENGSIYVTRYVEGDLSIPVVNDIKNKKLQGSTCVLTKTNADAMNIVGLMQKNNLSAKIIQTNTGFNLYDLVELRSFSQDLKNSDEVYTILPEVWKRAKYNLTQKFKSSTNLSGCLKLVHDFEETNPRTKYRSDFEQFLRESKMEDFFAVTEDTTLVSTIHQAKGRQFDNVFMALSAYQKIGDSTLRAIYVAMTRAKKSLYIHYIGDYFEDILLDIPHRTEDQVYCAPPEIIISLTHRDINLGSFADNQDTIDALVSGHILESNEYGCYAFDELLLNYSAKFYKQISRLKYKGYAPKFATVKNIVYWWDKKAKKELKIILPEIHFTKD